MVLLIQQSDWRVLMNTNEKILKGEGLDPIYDNVSPCYYCVFEYHCKRDRDFSKPCSNFKGDTTVGGFDR